MSCNITLSMRRSGAKRILEEVFSQYKESRNKARIPERICVEWIGGGGGGWWGGVSGGLRQIGRTMRGKSAKNTTLIFLGCFKRQMMRARSVDVAGREWVHRCRLLHESRAICRLVASNRQRQPWSRHSFEGTALTLYTWLVSAI